MKKIVLKNRETCFQKAETRFQNAETRFQNAKTALSRIFFARTWMVKKSLLLASLRSFFLIFHHRDLYLELVPKKSPAAASTVHYFNVATSGSAALC